MEAIAFYIQFVVFDFAIQTINTDEKVEYSEIKFFKNIRRRLKLSNEKILEHFPDIEQFLEEDIIKESFPDKITSQYLEIAELPQFNFISIDSRSFDNLDKEWWKQSK